MNNEIDIGKEGIMLHWKLFVIWGWKIAQVIMYLVLGGSIWSTHTNFKKVRQDVVEAKEKQDKIVIENQRRQDRRMEQIEDALEKCLRAR